MVFMVWTCTQTRFEYCVYISPLFFLISLPDLLFVPTVTPEAWEGPGECEISLAGQEPRLKLPTPSRPSSSVCASFCKTSRLRRSPVYTLFWSCSLSEKRRWVKFTFYFLFINCKTLVKKGQEGVYSSMCSKARTNWLSLGCKVWCWLWPSL